MYIMGTYLTFSKTMIQRFLVVQWLKLLPVQVCEFNPGLVGIFKISHDASCGPKIKKQNKATKIRHQEQDMGPEQLQGEAYVK